jgi:hypothetical protein
MDGAPIGAPPPFALFRSWLFEMAWHSSGAKAHRENELCFGKRETNEKQISGRHELHRVETDAVSRASPASRARDQQCAPLLAVLRECALPPRTRLPGFHVLLAAARGIIGRGGSAGARARRTIGEAFVDRLHLRLGSPSALLNENYAVDAGVDGRIKVG